MLCDSINVYTDYQLIINSYCLNTSYGILYFIKHWFWYGILVDDVAWLYMPEIVTEKLLLRSHEKECIWLQHDFGKPFQGDWQRRNISIKPINVKYVKICCAPMDDLLNGNIIAFSRLLFNYSYLFEPQPCLISRHNERIRLVRLFIKCSCLYL